MGIYKKRGSFWKFGRLVLKGSLSLTNLILSYNSIISDPLPGFLSKLSIQNSILLPPSLSSGALRPDDVSWPHLTGLCDNTQWTHHTRLDSSGRVTSSMHRPLPDNTQHSQKTDIHAPGGILIQNSSKRRAADPRLRPRGYWDRR